MKNKLIAVSLAAILALTAAALGGCGSGKDAGGGKSGNNVTIAVPNDATNEAADQIGRASCRERV